MPKSGAVVPGGSGPGTLRLKYLIVVSLLSSCDGVVASSSGPSQSQSGKVQSQLVGSGQLHVGGQSGFEQSHSGSGLVLGAEVVIVQSEHSGMSGNCSHMRHSNGTHSSLSSPSEQATGVVIVIL